MIAQLVDALQTPDPAMMTTLTNDYARKVNQLQSGFNWVLFMFIGAARPGPGLLAR